MLSFIGEMKLLLSCFQWCAKLLFETTVYAAFCGLIGYCFLLLDRFNVSKLKDFYGLKRWNISLVMEWMKTNRGGNDLDYVVDVDNICNERSKHLPVPSIVFSSVCKKIFHPAASFESGFWRKKERNMIFICVKIL